MCFGASAPAAPPAPPPPPPPRYAQAPTAASVRASTATAVGKQTVGTLLTGGQGDQVSNDTLGKKTLLGG